MDDDTLNHLPGPVQQLLTLIVNALEDAIGKTSFADSWVVLHGSAMQPANWHDETSDINLLVVLDHTPSVQELEHTHDAIEPLRRRWPMTLEFIAREELIHSTDVFPLKYLDIQRHHAILHGPHDALADLEIAWDHLRLRLEQRLKSLLARLRHTIPMARIAPEQLIHLLDHELAGFWQCLSTLLFLQHSDWWVASHSALMESAETELDITPQTLGTLLAIRRRTHDPSAKNLYHIMSDWHDIVTQLAHTVDHLDQRQELS